MHNAETMEALRKIHPTGAADQKHPKPPHMNSLQVTRATVSQVIIFFPPGSSIGHDGLTPQHIKDMTCDETHSLLVELITDFVSLLLSGISDQLINNIFYGGRLIALQKKSRAFWPIAIGYIQRRLAAKCANQHALIKLTDFLSPFQLGVGNQGGAEAAVHAIRRYATNLNDNKIIIKLDFTNAFNTLRRDRIFEPVASVLPELYNFTYSSYEGHPILQFVEHTITSDEGVQQGDPLGLLEFRLTLHPLLKRLSSELIVVHFDDFTIGGDINSVIDDLRTILQISKQEYGLSPCIKKCKITALEKFTAENIPETREFTFTPLADLTLYGTPVTTGAALDKILDAKIDDVAKAIQRLSYLHAHDALTLIRHRVSVPKLYTCPKIFTMCEYYIFTKI